MVSGLRRCLPIAHRIEFELNIGQAYRIAIQARMPGFELSSQSGSPGSNARPNAADLAGREPGDDRR